MKTVAIIQARMGSTRLPGKVLSEICGRPMIGILLHRLRMTKGLDDIVVATTTNPSDDVLVDWLSQQHEQYFRGSEMDVLDRFWCCARQHNADVVVRITADDPLKDPAVIERALKLFKSHQEIDYVSNTLEPSYPEGLDVEVFSFTALDRANREAHLPSEREHVTPYIWKNSSKFSLLGFAMEPDLSRWRWTVDKPEDLQFVRDVLEYFDNDIEIGYEKIIELIKMNPKLSAVNAGTVRNEGYLNSVLREI